VVDRLVLQARTFAGAGAFNETSARAHAEAEVAEIPDARLVRLRSVGHRLPAHAVPAISDDLLAHTTD
jgi:hypothetical protein